MTYTVFVKHWDPTANSVVTKKHRSVTETTHESNGGLTIHSKDRTVFYGIGKWESCECIVNT